MRKISEEKRGEISDSKPEYEVEKEHVIHILYFSPAPNNPMRESE